MLGASSTIETGIDELLKLLETHDRISIPEAAKLLKLPEDVVEAWAHTLEEDGDIEIEYSLTTPFIIPKRKVSAPNEYTILLSRVQDALKKRRYPQAWQTLDTLLDLLRGMIHDTPTIPDDVRKRLEDLNLLLAEKKRPRKKDVEEALHIIENTLGYITQQKEQTDLLFSSSPVSKNTDQAATHSQDTTPSPTKPASSDTSRTANMPADPLARLTSLLAEDHLDDALRILDDIIRMSTTQPHQKDLLSAAEERILTYLTTHESPLTRVNNLISQGKIDDARDMLLQLAQTLPLTPASITLLITLLSKIHEQTVHEEERVKTTYATREEAFAQALKKNDGKTARRILTELIDLSQHAPRGIRYDLIIRTLMHARVLAERVTRADEQERRVWQQHVRDHFNRLKHALIRHLPRSAEEELHVILRLLITVPPGGEDAARQMLTRLTPLITAYRKIAGYAHTDLDRIQSILDQAVHAPTLDSALSLYEEAVKLASTLPPLQPEARQRLTRMLHDTLTTLLIQQEEAKACADMLARARSLLSSMRAEEALALLTQHPCHQPSLKQLAMTLHAEARLLTSIQQGIHLPEASKLIALLKTSPYADKTLLHYIMTHIPHLIGQHRQHQQAGSADHTPQSKTKHVPPLTHAPHSTHPSHHTRPRSSQHVTKSPSSDPLATHAHTTPPHISSPSPTKPAKTSSRQAVQPHARLSSSSGSPTPHDHAPLPPPTTPATLPSAYTPSHQPEHEALAQSPHTPPAHSESPAHSKHTPHQQTTPPTTRQARHPSPPASSLISPPTRHETSQTIPKGNTDEQGQSPHTEDSAKRSAKGSEDGSAEGSAYSPPPEDLVRRINILRARLIGDTRGGGDA